MLQDIYKSETIIAETDGATPDSIPVRKGGYGVATQWVPCDGAESVVVQVGHAVAGKGTVEVYSFTNVINGAPNWVLEGIITDATPLHITTPCAGVKGVAKDVDGSNVIDETNFLEYQVRILCD